MTTLSIGTTTTSAYVLTPDITGTLLINTGSSNETAITLAAAGNVGIGTILPWSQSKLDIQGTAIRIGGATSGSAIAYTQYGSSATNAQNYLTGIDNGGYAVYQGTFGNTATEQLRIASDGTLKFNSGFGSAGPAYACRAWVRFNGTGTVSILGGGNVSSITDRGVGLYTVNLTNPMPDTSYAVVGTANQTDAVLTGGYDDNVGAYTFTTSSFFINTTNGSSGTSSSADMVIIAVAVFR